MSRFGVFLGPPTFQLSGIRCHLILLGGTLMQTISKRHGHFSLSNPGEAEFRRTVQPTPDLGHFFQRKPYIFGPREASVGRIAG